MSVSSADASTVRLLWSDDFNGPAGARPDPRKWVAVGGDWGEDKGELEYYTPRPTNVALDGRGHLVITARRQKFVSPAGATYSYTSGRVQTKGRFQTKYGCLEARIMLPAGRGLWPAFWALGSDIDRVDWPGAGEIDMMEGLGSDPFTVYGGIHGPQDGSADGYGLTANMRSLEPLTDRFHVYGAIWRPDQLVFMLDGKAYATFKPGSLESGQLWVFDKPFYLLLNLAVGGYWPGDPNTATTFPAKMYVDWVRVYK